MSKIKHSNSSNLQLSCEYTPKNFRTHSKLHLLSPKHGDTTHSAAWTEKWPPILRFEVNTTRLKFEASTTSKWTPDF